jgi:hypothetical protein
LFLATCVKKNLETCGKLPQVFFSPQKSNPSSTIVGPENAILRHIQSLHLLWIRTVGILAGMGGLGGCGDHDFKS